MDNLTLEHNGKKYRWVEGKQWGKYYTPYYVKLSLGKDMVSIDTEIMDGLGGKVNLNTCHTPEQLVALGYMEEVKEPEWVPKEGDTIIVWDYATSTTEIGKRVIVTFFKMLGEKYFTNMGSWKHAQQIPEPLQSEIKKLLNQQ